MSYHFFLAPPIRPFWVTVVVALFVLAGCTDESSSPASSSLTPDIEQPNSENLQEVDWAGLEYQLTPIAQLTVPIATAVRAGSNDLWVAERDGVVQRVALQDTVESDPQSDLDANESREIQQESTVVLDIADRISAEGEGGLLGLAFSADGSNLYVSYTNLNGSSVISEFEMRGQQAEPEERIVYTADQPFSNHNGGQILFGPDGYLYIFFGDGGSAGDPEQNGQDTTTPLGSILRIDPTPSSSRPYSIPEDNPFVTSENDYGIVGALPELWTWGVRNPWRNSFDAETGDLWVADVGQDSSEEINVLTENELGGKAVNLGWNKFEGNESFTGAQEPARHHRPLYSYQTTDVQCSVVGGYVYRGQEINPLTGVYLFSDFCSGSIIGLTVDDDGDVATAPLQLDRQPESVLSFGQGPGNEIFLLEQGGQVSRLTLASGGSSIT